MRVAPPSLAPYSSQICALGSASMMRRFTSMGHGAAPWMMSRSDDRSYCARSVSGTSRMRMKWAGTMKLAVTR